MKIIFGGAFNPVTNAHIKVCEHVMKEVPCDEFIFLPVSNAYTKSDLASDYHRLNMLNLALKNFENVRVSELELNDSDFLGTYQSLIRFSDSENTALGFVIGADNLIGMEHWINIEGILSEFRIIVLPRDGIDVESQINSVSVLKKYRQSFIILKDFGMDVSSTKFRETFDQTKVPSDVYEYVMKNGLYQVDEDDRI